MTDFAWQILGTVLGLLGLFGLTIRLRPKKRLVYRTSSLRTGSPLVPIDHLRQNHPHLTVTNIVIWNNGIEHVDHEDTAKKDPVRLEGKGDTRILEAEIIYQTKPAFDLKVNAGSQHTRAVRFDFIDPGEGAIIRVVHTGRQGPDLTVKGTIKGKGVTTHALLQVPEWFWTVAYVSPIFVMLLMGKLAQAMTAGMDADTAGKFVNSVGVTTAVIFYGISYELNKQFHPPKDLLKVLVQQLRA